MMVAKRQCHTEKTKADGVQADRAQADRAQADSKNIL